MSWLLLSVIALAELPLDVYPDCGPEGGCPSDFGGWEKLSWVPDNSVESVRPAELELGSGMSLDEAFRRSTGRWDNAVAILDSGIFWHDRRLHSKVLINQGELPPPQLADGSLVPDADLDSNGIFNLDDYSEDPRVDVNAGVVSADGMLDPSDLIYTFSDGVDDDGYGYVDDIAGWDFFGWDNDPYPALETGYASHGTGVMKAAVQAGEDGGDIGVCPNCALLPIRVGDTFLTDGDRIAMAIAFATDHGVSVVGMALGGLTTPSAIDDAIAYAEANDVTLVAAAGDENSYHHNMPGAKGHILYVHSVRGNNTNEGGGNVYSYMSFLNCNNYGPRMDLVAGASDCATGAVARIAGAAGLIASAGVEAGLDLSASEVRGLLRHSADDVWLSDEELDISGTYPSAEGYDTHYGYGRLNVGEAVRRVFDGEVPPVARIDSPEWFTFQDGDLVVEGEVSSRQGTPTWTLSIGTGLEPDDWSVVASGSGASEGVLATVDLSDVPSVHFDDLLFEQVIDRTYRANEPLVTLLLEVTANGLSADNRRGVWVHRDHELLPGFPKQLAASIEASPQIVDLDGDHVDELIIVSSDGVLHVLDATGTERAGFPVSTNQLPDRGQGWAGSPAFESGAMALPNEGVLATPAVGDIDGDGEPEIIIGSLRGKLYAWHIDGTAVDGFPVSIDIRAPDEMLRDRAWDEGIAGAPSLGDIDGDGVFEIIVAGMDQRLYAWSGAGQRLAGYPVELCDPDLCGWQGARIISSPALGDIDGDGDLDAALGTNEVPTGAAGLLYIVDLASASVWDGYPLGRDGLINQAILPIVGEGHPTTPALADLDGDGDLELASQPMLSNNDPIEHDGTVAIDLVFTASAYGDAASYGQGSVIGMVNNPIFADLDLDGAPDMVMGGASATYLVSLALTSVYEYQHAMGAWSGATGEFLQGWPRQVDDVGFLSAPSVVDISGDVRPEVIYGSGGHLLYAADVAGYVTPGWPKFTGGWLLGAPSTGDIDGDGLLEVVAVTREGMIFAWNTKGSASKAAQWSSLHHDAMNTSNFETELPAHPKRVTPSSGCCGGDGGSAWFVLPLLPLWLRRRRA
jgi:hypothetical protein